MISIPKLLARIDPVNGTIQGAHQVLRHLSDLRGCFAGTAAYDAALAIGDPLLYSVASVEPGIAEGDLHYALGRLMPGRIGAEYFMTKGHLHAWREAAELYIGLSGDGGLLLEDELTGESQWAPLPPFQAVYVPGRTAHRTMNIGTVPLIYLGIYPARAGHDYDALAVKNFRCMVLERDGQAVMIERSSLRP